MSILGEVVNRGRRVSGGQLNGMTPLQKGRAWEDNQWE